MKLVHKNVKPVVVLVHVNNNVLLHVDVMRVVLMLVLLHVVAHVLEHV